MTASHRRDAVPTLAVLAPAALVAAWLALDVDRQRALGVADAGVWFTVLAAYLALAAAVLLTRSAVLRRMGLLVVWWVATAVAVDVVIVWPGSGWATTLLLVALALESPAFAHMTLAYPTGRVRDPLERGFVVVAYLAGIAWELPPALFVDASTCRTCTPHVSSLIFTGHTFDIRPVGQAFSALFIALGIAFLALIVRRLCQAPPGASRTLFPLAVAGAFATTQFILLRVAWLADWSAPLATLDWLDNASLLAVPAALLAGSFVIRRHRGTVGDLIVELASAPPGEVRAALARALGDPSIELGLWLPDRRAFVDERGHALALDRGDRSRATTLIGPSREPLAVIVHDPGLAGQRPLLEAAGSAARMALENARLHADLRAQLDELRRSRSRIVTAGDLERRRLERDLHDGAQQRLLALGLALQLLTDNDADPRLLVEAREQLAAALQELRDLARGIHPAVLSERGLAAAVGTLADRAPLSVTVDAPDERFPEVVETAAYFIVSEALTNVAKHAEATTAAVTIATRDHTVLVEVRDDGRGGAATRSRGGLEGLADRVGAVGGRIRVTSPAGEGTTVHAELPCDW